MRYVHKMFTEILYTIRPGLFLRTDIPQSSMEFLSIAVRLNR